MHFTCISDQLKPCKKKRCPPKHIYLLLKLGFLDSILYLKIRPHQHSPLHCFIPGLFLLAWHRQINLQMLVTMCMLMYKCLQKLCFILLKQKMKECAALVEVCALWYVRYHSHIPICTATLTSLRATSARDWRSVQVSRRLWSSLSWTEAASSRWERSSSSSLVRAPTLICVKTICQQKKSI